MQVIYKPKLNPDQSPIAGMENGVAHAILLPDNYDPGKKYVLEIAVHGIGELSAGTLANLENLVLGPDYNGDGVREGNPFVTADMKKAVDLYDIVMVIPTYSKFFEPQLVNWCYDHAQANYNLYPKFIYTGFSLGGGAGIKYGTSSEANAKRLAYLVLCAPTVNMVDKTIPGKVGLPVHCFHNDKDDRVNVSSTKTIVSAINETATLKAIYTIFREDGHGGNIEAWSLTPPKAPNGQGFTDSAENIYQVATDIIKTGIPRQMKSGTPSVVIPSPTEPPPGTQAIVSYTIEGNNIHLRGDKSTGYTSGTQGKWELVSAPNNLKSWDVFPKGSTYINADGVMPVPGTYVFRFILLNTSPVEVVVNHGEAVKTFSGFDSTTDLITYSDGSTEPGTAVFSNGKWTVKNQGGQIIQ